MAAILSGEAGRDGEAEEPEGHEQPGTADEPAEQGGLVPAVIGIAVVEREVDGVEAVRDLVQEETHGARRVGGDPFPCEPGEVAGDLRGAEGPTAGRLGHRFRIADLALDVGRDAGHAVVRPVGLGVVADVEVQASV